MWLNNSQPWFWRIKSSKGQLRNSSCNGQISHHLSSVPWTPTTLILPTLLPTHASICVLCICTGCSHHLECPSQPSSWVFKPNPPSKTKSIGFYIAGILLDPFGLKLFSSSNTLPMMKFDCHILVIWGIFVNPPKLPEGTFYTWSIFESPVTPSTCSESLWMSPKETELISYSSCHCGSSFIFI